MDGLNKITEMIIGQATAQADEINKKTQNQIDEMESELKTELNRLKSEAEKRAADESDKIIKMSEAENIRYKRQVALMAKQEAISKIIAESKKILEELPDNEYFDMLLTLYKNNASDKAGELLLSKKDKERMPKDFVEKCNAAVGSVTLSDEDAPIESGFIIRYGKIEQNCTLEGIFEDKMNILSDLVSRCLE